MFFTKRILAGNCGTWPPANPMTMKRPSGFSVRNASSTLAVSYGRVRVSSIIYLVGLIVVVMAILSFIGLR